MSAQEIKDREKEDTFREKGFRWCGDWHRQDKVDTIGLASIFFWGAFVLLADNTGFASNLQWSGDGWGVFFTGAGVIVLVQTCFRLFMPEYRRGVASGFTFGSVLLAIGLDGWSLIMPLVLAAIGVSILFKAFPKKR